MRANLEKREYHISVKDLVFLPVVKMGQFSGIPISRTARANQGRELHQQFQSNALKLDSSPRISVKNEKTVKYNVNHKGWHFIITGRADSVQITAKKIVVQEIKSVVDLSLYNQNPQSKLFTGYRRQLLIYAHIFKHDFPHHEIIPQLVVMEIGTEHTQIVDVSYENQKKYIVEQCDAILDLWQEEEKKKKQLRTREESIIFPFPSYRPYQEEMMEKISEALKIRKNVILNAPTGLGKTVGSLIPSLRYAIASNLRLFIVTSKTTQQKIYSDTLRIMSKQKAQFHAVVLTAKEKMCINDTYLCDPHFCPFISNYQEEKVIPVIKNLLKHPVLQAPYIRKIARKERLCPFELALDSSLECDVIVGDYNYVFNPQVRLQRYFEDTHDDCIILIDEAHNLPDRARDYYSPSINYTEAKEVKFFIEKQSLVPEIKEMLKNQMVNLLSYFKQMHSALKSYHDQRVIPVKVDERQFKQWNQAFDKVIFQYIKALGQDVEQIIRPDDLFLTFTRSFSFFVRLLKSLNEAEYQLLYYPAERRLQIFCKSAHRELQKQMQGFYSVIAQSATLTPSEYYRKMLGFPKNALYLRYSSPFSPKNRLILNFTGISTRYEHREGTYSKIADLIFTTLSVHPGNYLAFFPSFSFLDEVYHYLQQYNLPVSLIKQERTMSERERRKVLKLLRTPLPKQKSLKSSLSYLKEHISMNQGYLLCGVHGGIFSEGVDYEGDMGIGVFIIGPGLPSYNFEQELIKNYFQQTMKKGFEYAYRNPGMTRVIQAAGRIFRSDKDRGIVLLIGNRFSLPFYASLFPPEWNITPFSEISELSPILRSFWKKETPFHGFK
ncbi:MAG: ATP-dependent DNA helicase [Promethearchaeota archaeon]